MQGLVGRTRGPPLLWYRSLEPHGVMDYTLKTYWNWEEGRSIINGRSPAGQIQLKKKGKGGVNSRHTFFVRLGDYEAKTVKGTREDALQELKAMVARRQAGVEVQKRSRIRFGTFITDHFLPWARSETSAKTYSEYERLLMKEVVPVLGKYYLDGLDREILMRMVEEFRSRALKPKTLKSYVATLKRPINWAVQERFLSWNPASNISALPPKTATTSTEERLKKVELIAAEDPFATADQLKKKSDLGDNPDGSIDPRSYWTTGEAALFEAASDETDEIVRWIRIAIRAGFRPQEQCGLVWRCIDYSAGEVSVDNAVVEVGRKGSSISWGLAAPKLGVARKITVDSEVLRLLRLQQQHVESLYRAGKIDRMQASFVFTSRGKNPFQNPATVADRMRNFFLGRPGRKNSTGFDLVPRLSSYGPRHTCATQRIRGGEDSVLVAIHLGTSVEMLRKHYVHVFHETSDEDRVA